jgi:hypothetical protein
MQFILLIAFFAAIAFPAKWFSQLTPPVVVGALCGVLVLLGWAVYLASLLGNATTARSRRMRQLVAVFLVAAAPMSCSTVNYLSADATRDVFGFQKETARGYEAPHTPYRYRTRGQRRAAMMKNLPGQIGGRLAFAVSPHGSTLLAAAVLGVVPFALLFRRESSRDVPSRWLNGNFWIWTSVAAIFFLVVFSQS